MPGIRVYIQKKLESKIRYLPEQYKNEKGHSGAHYKIEIAVAGKNAKQYRLMHDKIYINSDDAIERNNNLYPLDKMKLCF
jgi:hypothetical protein